MALHDTSIHFQRRVGQPADKRYQKTIRNTMHAAANSAKCPFPLAVMTKKRLTI
jgi:hypothetical protein